MEQALIDTGVLYGMFDKKDAKYEEVNNKMQYFDSLRLVIPWPIVYETLRTRFMKNRSALEQFEKFLKTPNIVYDFDDTKYRKDAFDLSLKSSLRKHRPISMVDCLLRLVIDDPNVKIDYLFTFNKADFIDACKSNGVEIL